MPHVDQELLTGLEYLSSPPICTGNRDVQFLFFCDVFCGAVFYSPFVLSILPHAASESFMALRFVVLIHNVGI